jgi:acetylornithine deacetylase
MEQELKRILSGLVGLNTISAQPNEPAIAFIEHELAGRGWHLRRLPYQREGQERINLLALSSVTDRPELALVGHTDTVPWDENWAEATTLVEKDGLLYGRGTCDMKGFLACMLALARSIDPATLAKPLALIFTADEEIGCVGAKQLVAGNAVRPRYAIVGEPTSLQPVRAGKGYCLAEIVVYGREAHSAFPRNGVSAIAQAARLIAGIEKLAALNESRRHAFFDPPCTTVNIGQISGGTAKNIIPGQCRLTVEWRPIAGEEPRAFGDLLTVLVREMHSSDARFEAIVNVQRLEGGFETPAASRIVQLLEKLTSSSATSVAYGTEAPQLTALGAETVVWGPGNMRVAHRTGEHVALDELVRTTALLGAAVRDLCA